jgi:ketosteroid isomerase-like protein
MQRAVTLLAVLVLVSGFTQAQTKPTSGDTEKALMDIEHRWAATSLKGDVATLETILAANWTGITVEGAVETRAQGIERTRGSRFTKSEVSGMKVMLLNPTTAVVTGVWTGVGTGSKGEKVDTSERWTDVFVNQGGTWKCTASQSTTIKR